VKEPRDNNLEDGRNENREDRPHRIRPLLVRLRDQRSLLSAHFRGRSQSFGTLLLTVDLDNNQLELDELTPRDGDLLVKLHQQFFVSGQLDGAQIDFPVQVTKREIREGLASYWAAIPDSIQYHQRRKAFRVDAPAHPACRMVLTNQEGDWFEGRLADLSVTGAGFLLSARKAVSLPRGERCECEIELPCGSIETKVDIRFNMPVRDKPHHRLGAQFTDLAVADRRRIERFVFDLQRKQLKTER